ncbi:MAG: ABC transporter permease subunit [Hyphomicrobiales bacterium]
MRNILAIAKRELKAYFGTPIAYVFLAIFVALTGVFTFFIGNFFGRGVADLQPFFQYHPWLYLMLVPAISMRLWAEERKSGTIELLMTLPVTTTEAVIGKWLAGWIFLGFALVLTFPIWITVNVLGDPDNGVIFASYIASFLVAGAFLAIGACMSALTKNQVIAFVIAAVVCFFFVMGGSATMLDAISGLVPDVVVQAVGNLSAIVHFDNVARGTLAITDIIYFVSLIAFWLFANVITIELKKAD